MPTYTYACTDCGHRFDTVQSFSDDALTTCPECSGKLRKVFSPVGVVFKGGGFYRTDSRSGSSSSVPASSSESKSDSGSSASSGSSGSSGKGESSSSSAKATTSTGGSAA
ncbi:FmdB family zinc ribbon protein [Knoellia koreensis]|uniref:FmdB family transcriptional regulator n=1 Tax=Knoellia koreensis TaxID=2730921 RepID=A0A849HJL7_9MICO|nr:FmdB family transcriptional regulator [Knoellia sp. DB2414S]